MNDHRGRLATWLASLFQDSKNAVRRLRTDWRMSLGVAVTLGIAIGLNASVASATSGLAPRSWDVPSPGEVSEVLSARTGEPLFVNREELRRLEALTSTGFEIAGRSATSVTMRVDSVVVSAEAVSGSYFSALRIPILTGRGLTHDDDRTGARPVVVISEVLWRSRFGARRDIIGTPLSSRGSTYTIVGITSFRGTRLEATGMWLPTASLRAAQGGDRVLTPVVRSSFDRLSAQQLFRQHVSGMFSGAPEDAVLVPPMVGGRSAERIQAVLLPIGIATGLVYLLACLNVGSLLLATTLGRFRELSVRSALGASGFRLQQQLILEGLALAGLSLAVGVVTAVVVPRLVFAYLAGLSGRPIDPSTGFQVDVLAVSATLAVLACVICSIAPARFAGKARMTRFQVEPLVGPRIRVRQVLLALQVALAITLLVGAGTMLEAIRTDLSRDLGFRVDNIELVSFDSDGLTPNQTIETNDALMDLLHRGIAEGSIAVASAAPFGGYAGTTVRSVSQQGEDIPTPMVFVGGGYFDVLKIGLVAGRPLSPADWGAQVAVVNESLAAKLGLQQAAGARLRVGEATFEVVGIATNANLQNARVADAAPLLFLAMGDHGRAQALTFLAERSNPQLAALGKGGAVPSAGGAELQIETLATIRARRYEQRQMAGRLAASVGVVALFIAALGLASLLAHVAQQRLPESAIRLALGGPWLVVAADSFRSTLLAIAVGMALGVALASASMRALANAIFGFSTPGMVPFAVVVGLVTLTGIMVAAAASVRLRRIPILRHLRNE